MSTEDGRQRDSTSILSNEEDRLPTGDRGENRLLKERRTRPNRRAAQGNLYQGTAERLDTGLSNRRIFKESEVYKLQQSET